MKSMMFCGGRNLAFAATMVAVTAYGNPETSLTTSGGWTDEPWTSDSIWNRGVPSDGSYTAARPGSSFGELRIYLTEDLTTSMSRFYTGAGNGTGVTLDANGYNVIPKPFAAGSDYVFESDYLFYATPFHNNDYNAFFKYQIPSGLVRETPYAFTDPKIRFATEDGVAVYEFQRGSFNFYDPEGSTPSTSRMLYFGISGKIPTVMRFATGTVFRVGAVDTRVNGVSNAVELVGAKMIVFGSWQDGYTNGKLDKPSDLTLTDGAELVISGSVNYVKWNGYSDGTERRRILLRNHATIRTCHAVEINTPNTTIDLKDSTWDASGVTLNWPAFGFATSADAMSFRMSVSNSTWKLGGTSVMYGADTSEGPRLSFVAGGSRFVAGLRQYVFQHALADIADSVFESTAPAGSAILARHGADLTLRNCAVTNYFLSCGFADSGKPDSGSCVLLDGGDFQLGRIRIGEANVSGSGEGVVRISSGAVVLHGTNASGADDLASSRADVGLKSPGALELLGGTLEAAHVNGGEAGVKSGDAVARLLADGGTVVCRGTDSKAWIHGLDVAEVGAGGLVLDTNGFDPAVNQDFTDAEGESGTLVKSGEGTLMMSVAGYSVATTTVTRGTLAVRPSDADAFSTHLVLAEGSTFSLADGSPTELRLASLEVENATLLLDTNDTIVVDGTAEFTGLTLRFSEAPCLGQSLNCLEVHGDLSAQSQAELRRAILDNDVAEGAHTRMDIAYDVASGTWSVSCSVRTDVAPLSASTTWRGPSWNLPSSWTDGVPTAETKAVFNGSSEAIEVPEGAVAGALVFAGDCTLVGGELEIGAEQGAARIDVTAGTVEIGSPLVLDGAKVFVSVAAGASLAVNGSVRIGDLLKTGDGAFSLGGANALRRDESFAGGLNTLAHSAVLSGATKLLLGGGTLATTAEMDLPSAAIAPEDQAKPQVLKTEADTTMGPMDVTGAFLKRGVGKLTIDYTGERVTHVLSTVKTDGAKKEDGGKIGLPHDYSRPYSFPADGSAPEDGFEGFTVAEGELVIKGDSCRQNINGSVLVGMYTPDGTVQPSLTFDGVNLRNYGYGSLTVGLMAGADGGFANRPTLRILNGASLVLESTCFGYGVKADADCEITVAMTNGSYFAISQSILSYCKNLAHPVKIRAKDSSLTGPEGAAAYIDGAIDADLDHSTIASNVGAGDFTVTTSDPQNIGGRIVLRNGSLWNIKRFNLTKLSKELALVFDDSEWQWGGGNFTLELPDTLDADLFPIRMQGRGMKVSPAAGETLTFAYPLVGDGGFQLVGAGTVVFEDGMCRFTGPACAKSGTIDLSRAGEICSAAFGGGDGVISGGALASAVLALEASDDWTVTNGVPRFSSCAFSGTTRVTFGRTESAPLAATPPENLLVARYEGTAPDVSRWRLKGTGLKGTKGVFTAQNGEVRVTASVGNGLLLILR